MAVNLIQGKDPQEHDYDPFLSTGAKIILLDMFTHSTKDPSVSTGESIFRRDKAWINNRSIALSLVVLRKLFNFRSTHATSIKLTTGLTD